MSMKQYSNFFNNFTVTRIVTENTKYDSKKEKHIKLAKPEITKEVIFAPKDLHDFADLVRACDVVSDSEGYWYNHGEDKRRKRVLKVEFELDVMY